MGSTWAIETTLAAAALELCPRNGAHALVGCAAGSTTSLQEKYNKQKQGQHEVYFQVPLFNLSAPKLDGFKKA